MMRQGLLVSFTFLLLATGCSSASQNYTYETAIQNGDIVSEGTTTGNLDKFYKFLADIESHQPSEVKITRYTKEGDPIFSNLKFDGEKIEVFEDASKDKFGGGKRTFQCLSIEQQEKSDEIAYYLAGCDNSSQRSMLTIKK